MTAVAEQDAAAARTELPIEARRQAARVMYAESVAAGVPVTAGELGAAFGRSERWGRERVTEVRQQNADLAKSAESAVPADRAAAASEPDTTAEEPAVPDSTEDTKRADDGKPQGEQTAPADRPRRPLVLGQYLRIRWGVRATLGLGVVASTVANVLHANDNPISQTIAAWPPLALLFTIELISRVPVHARWLAAVRFTATAVIAGIAAWVSYWHMADVISRYGETGASPYLIPLTVDGLVVVASVCLVELGSRIRALATEANR